MLRLLMVFVKTLLPPDCTPPATACDVSTGTSWPTFIVAGMLSVATMLGAETTRDWWLLSAAVTAAGVHGSAEPARPWTASCRAAPLVAFRIREGIPDPPVPTFCRYAATPAEKAPVSCNS